jgi:hypothetical protein
MSVWIKGNKKASRLFIGGKDISKAYYNGNLIFNKNTQTPIYGTLYWYDDVSGNTLSHDIETTADWNLVNKQNNSYNQQINLAFSFATIDIADLRGFVWNLNPDDAHKVTNVPAYHMHGWMNVNMPVTFPDYVLAIGDYCLEYNPNLNQYYGAGNFNQPVDVGNGCLTIGNGFMYRSQGGGIFNSEINLRNVHTLGNNCISGLPVYNNTLNISNVTNIGTNFLSNCYAFNKPLDTHSLVAVGSMLIEARGFNQNLTIPANCQIGQFLSSTNRGSIIFARTLTLESGVTITSTEFLWASSGAFTVICNTDPYNIAGAGGTSTSMTTTRDAGTINQYYGGTYGSTLITAFPNGTYDSGGTGRNWIAA